MKRAATKRRAPGQGVAKSAVRKRIVVAFVAFHLAALVLFAIPVEVQPVPALRDLVAPYMRCIGMTDTWNMFAPNPKSGEQFLRAIVITRSGQYKLYSFPRMEELPLATRYRQERYRKFAESVICRECSPLWPDIGRAVARREMDPADPPDRVLLVKFESPIDAPGGAGKGALGEDAAAQPTVLAQYSVQPEDLR